MTRRFLIVASTFAAIALGQPGSIYAQDQVAPEVENSRQNFSGVINSSAVYVRSGPGENYYPTMKLDKGVAVTVVGIKFDWLKIVPPEGSFSYVAKAYVEKRGDGSIGRVTKPDLNVRAGSDLNAMKTTVQSKLDAGQDVQIVGEQDEYFKVKPPEGAFLYINKQFVDPVKALEAPIAGAAESKDPIATATPVVPNAEAANAVLLASVTNASTTQPSKEIAAAPTTQESQPVVSIESQFEAVETQFMDSSKLPIDQQPIDEMVSGYRNLTADASLPVSMRRIAEIRLNTLQLRTEAKNQYAEARRLQEESASRTTALKAEHEELQQQIKDNEIKVYTVIGTLRTSSLQLGAQPLYRLTDPSTGRTLSYIRTDDAKAGAFIGQLVGVRGDLVTDPGLNTKVVTPTALEAVDASRVNNGVTATILPPSLLPKAVSASTDNQ